MNPLGFFIEGNVSAFQPPGSEDRFLPAAGPCFRRAVCTTSAVRQELLRLEPGMSEGVQIVSYEQGQPPPQGVPKARPRVGDSRAAASLRARPRCRWSKTVRRGW